MLVGLVLPRWLFSLTPHHHPPPPPSSHSPQLNSHLLTVETRLPLMSVQKIFRPDSPLAQFPNLVMATSLSLNWSANSCGWKGWRFVVNGALECPSSLAARLLLACCSLAARLLLALLRSACCSLALTSSMNMDFSQPSWIQLSM